MTEHISISNHIILSSALDSRRRRKGNFISIIGSELIDAYARAWDISKMNVLSMNEVFLMVRYRLQNKEERKEEKKEEREKEKKKDRKKKRKHGY